MADSSGVFGWIAALPRYQWMRGGGLQPLERRRRRLRRRRPRRRRRRRRLSRRRPAPPARQRRLLTSRESGSDKPVGLHSVVGSEIVLRSSRSSPCFLLVECCNLEGHVHDRRPRVPDPTPPTTSASRRRRIRTMMLNSDGSGASDDDDSEQHEPGSEIELSMSELELLAPKK